MTREIEWQWKPDIPTVDEIVRATAYVFGLQASAIYARSHLPYTARARIIAYHVANEFGYPTTRIGMRMQRDHSTVVNALHRTAQQRKDWQDYVDAIHIEICRLMRLRGSAWKNVPKDATRLLVCRQLPNGHHRWELMPSACSAISCSATQTSGSASCSS